MDSTFITNLRAAGLFTGKTGKPLLVDSPFPEMEVRINPESPVSELFQLVADALEDGKLTLPELAAIGSSIAAMVKQLKIPGKKARAARAKAEADAAVVVIPKRGPAAVIDQGKNDAGEWESAFKAKAKRKKAKAKAEVEEAGEAGEE